MISVDMFKCLKSAWQAFLRTQYTFVLLPNLFWAGAKRSTSIASDWRRVCSEGPEAPGFFHKSIASQPRSARAHTRISGCFSQGRGVLHLAQGSSLPHPLPQLGGEEEQDNEPTVLEVLLFLFRNCLSDRASAQCGR